MNYSPLEFQESLEIGQVDFVSPDELKVQLNIDAPENVSLSTGKPRVFPRINSYVLIHTEEGYVGDSVNEMLIDCVSFLILLIFLSNLLFEFSLFKLNPLLFILFTKE